MTDKAQPQLTQWSSNTIHTRHSLAKSSVVTLLCSIPFSVCANPCHRCLSPLLHLAQTLYIGTDSAPERPAEKPTHDVNQSLNFMVQNE